MIIERLAYDGLSERYDVDIFTANQTGQDFSKLQPNLNIISMTMSLPIPESNANSLRNLILLERW